MAALLALGATLGIPQPAFGDTIYDVYFANTIFNRIDRVFVNELAESESGVPMTVANMTEHPVSIAVDFYLGKIYWSEDVAAAPDTLWRSNLNGSRRELLIGSTQQPVANNPTALNNPTGVVIDPFGQKMYFTEEDGFGVSRADLDGLNIERLVPQTDSGGNTGVGGIDLDLVAGMVYFSNEDTGEIGRADLDGSNYEVIVSGLTEPRGMAVDPGNDTIYWVDRSTGGLMRADLDGSNVGTIVGGDAPNDIAIDLNEGNLFWADNGTVLGRNLNIGVTNNLTPNIVAGAFAVDVAPTSLSAYLNGSEEGFGTGGDLNVKGVIINRDLPNPQNANGENPANPADDDVAISLIITRAGTNDYLLQGWFDTDDNKWFDLDELFIDVVLSLEAGSFYEGFNFAFDPAEFGSRFRLTFMDGIDVAISDDVRAWGVEDSGEVENYFASASVPEPSTALLLSFGLLTLAATLRGPKAGG